MKIPAIIIALLALTGCDEPQVEQTPKLIPAKVVPSIAYTNRFTAQSFGKFYGGLDNSPREIFIIHDNASGHDYLAITGCGSCELWTETKSHYVGKTRYTTTETVEE